MIPPRAETAIARAEVVIWSFIVKVDFFKFLIINCSVLALIYAEKSDSRKQF